jgi:hypothetical protein
MLEEVEALVMKMIPLPVSCNDHHHLETLIVLLLIDDGGLMKTLMDVVEEE